MTTYSPKPAEWFIERIGHRIYRNSLPYCCDRCEKVAENGLIIHDETHARYLAIVDMDSGAEGIFSNYRDNMKEENFHSTCETCHKLIPNQHFDCERENKKVLEILNEIIHAPRAEAHNRAARIRASLITNNCSKDNAIMEEDIAIIEKIKKEVIPEERLPYNPRNNGFNEAIKVMEHKFNKII